MSSLILPYAGLDAGQPASLSPDYRSTVARSPRLAPIAIPQTLTEVTGPTDWSRLMGPAMADLTTQHKAEPQGQRIVVTGRVLDEDGRATLVPILGRPVLVAAPGLGQRFVALWRAARQTCA